MDFPGQDQVPVSDINRGDTLFDEPAVLLDRHGLYIVGQAKAGPVEDQPASPEQRLGDREIDAGGYVGVQGEKGGVRPEAKRREPELEEGAGGDQLLQANPGLEGFLFQDVGSGEK